MLFYLFYCYKTVTVIHRKERYHQVEMGRQEALQQKTLVIERNRLMEVHVEECGTKIQELEHLVEVSVR